jgi:cytochrome P450
MSATQRRDDGRARGTATSSGHPGEVSDLPRIEGYAAVKAAARDWSLFSSELQGERDVRDYRQYPVESDPPAHSDYRAILTPLFHRQRIGEFEAPIRALAASLVGQFVEAGRVDAVNDLALTMVVRSLGIVFGRPQDVDEWLSWGARVFERNGHRDGRHLDAYLDRVFDEVERNPSDDAFSHIAASSFEGRPLTRLEKLGIGSLVLAGGRDTVVSLISAAVWRLASYSDERQRLARDPSLIPMALDELLRYLSPLPYMERKVTGPAGEISAGSHVALSFLSANHDPSVFAEPETINLERRPNHHLAFGNGPHTCIGAHLGKLEARTFLEELLRTVPDFAFDDDVRIAWHRVGAAEVPKEFLSLPIAVVP